MITRNNFKLDLQDEGEILLIDKPIDWTSFDVVRKIKSIFNIKKAGHAGSIDPKATGLLIVCTGKKTKELRNFMELDKEYIGKFQLGITTPSYDTETEIVEKRDTSNIEETKVKELAKSFIGKRKQFPPIYSAIKYKGKPLYKYARKGRKIEVEPRDIRINEFEITNFDNPYVDFRISCSKGTYIRALVNEFGNILGCGATLLSLRRVRIGNYFVDDAISINELMESKQTE